MAAFTASGLMNVTAPTDTVGLYLIAGAGAYYLYQHPTAEGAVRLGLSAGVGFAFRVGSRSQLFVEARYHDVLGVPGQPTWLAPITFGIRL